MSTRISGSILLVLFVLGIGGPVQGQNKWTVGWKFGGNMAWNFYNNIQTDFDTDAKLIEKQFGWSVGFFAFRPWLGRDAIQIELLLSQHSSKYMEAENHFQTFRLTYLSLPVFYQKILQQKGNGYRSYLLAGPVFGIMIDTQYKNKIGVLAEKAAIKDANSFDIGLALGIGIMSAEKIIVDIRYQLGLLKIADSNAKNDVLALHFGFGF